MTRRWVRPGETLPEAFEGSIVLLIPLFPISALLELKERTKLLCQDTVLGLEEELSMLSACFTHKKY